MDTEDAVIDRKDLWKAWLVLAAVAGAISAHALALPPAFVPYEPYIEFTCGVIAIITAVFVRPPQVQ